MRRTERLFALAEHLRARRTGVTAEELADRFGVTVRTIYRDLDALRAAALPLHAERGRGGGYALDRAYSLPPVNFNAREAALLALAVNFVVEMRILPFSQPLSRAVDKVRAALPVSAQRDLARLEARLSFIGVPAHAGLPAVLEALETAFFEQRDLRIRYRSKDHIVTDRVVRVEGIIVERTETLVNCLDIEQGEIRPFRLHRIERATVLSPSVAGVDR
ncbi:MAG: HTH domain-containing protein [Polyangiaceae bacterium]|nr:HTH domain-containing protein [Polyangiaceae bacterium]